MDICIDIKHNKCCVFSVDLRKCYIIIESRTIVIVMLFISINALRILELQNCFACCFSFVRISFVFYVFLLSSKFENNSNNYIYNIFIFYMHV